MSRRFNSLLPGAGTHDSHRAVIYNGYHKYRVSVNGTGSITLNYGQIQADEVVDITFSLNEIPTGAQINMPSNSTIRVYDVSKLAGTEEHPVTFQGNDGVTFISINDITVEDADFGFAPTSLFDLLGGHVYIRNSVFKDIQTAGVYCKTNNSHFANVLEISNCQFEA